MVGTFDSTSDGIEEGKKDERSASDCADGTGEAITGSWSKRSSKVSGATAGGCTVTGAADGVLDAGDIDGDKLG